MKSRKFKVLKGGTKMATLVMEKERTEQKLNCMSNIKHLIQNSMKAKGITSVEVRKSLGIKKYEK